MDTIGGGVESMELTNRAVATWFHLIWEVWVIIANCAALAVSLVLLLKNKRAQETHLTVLSMTICDLTSGIVTLAFHIVSGGDFGMLTPAQCTVNATFLVFLCMQSMLLVLMLGFVRYRILVQKPLTLKLVQVALSVLWVTCLGYALFVALKPGLAVPSASRLYCFHRFGRFDAASTFVTAVAGLFGATPALVLLVCYVRAFQNVKFIETGTGKNDYSRMVAYMGFTVVLVYSLSILPWSCQVLYRLIVDPEQYVSPDIDAVFSIMVHLNFGINPILYFIFKRDYRRLIRRWLGCGPSRSSSGSTYFDEKSISRSATTFKSDYPSKGRLSRLNTDTLSKAQARSLPQLARAHTDTLSKARGLPQFNSEKALIESQSQQQINVECASYVSRSRISRIFTEGATAFSRERANTNSRVERASTTSEFSVSPRAAAESRPSSVGLRRADTAPRPSSRDRTTSASTGDSVRNGGGRIPSTSPAPSAASHGVPIMSSLPQTPSAASSTTAGGEPGSV